MSATLPFSVFSYSSYIEYFQDAYDRLHASDETFSYDRIAALCEFKSRTQARNFIKGIQKPTLTQALKIAQAFGLDSDGQEYISCLYQFQNVEGSSASYELFRKLAKLQKRKLPEVDPFKEIQIAASVLHMTLMTLLGLENAPQTPKEMTLLLKNRYTTEEIAAAISDLEESRYIEKSNGQWKLLQKHIKNYDMNPNFFLRSYHDQCLKVAEKALHEENTDERYLIGASFAVHHKVYPRIIQKLNQFMENLMQLEGLAGTPDMLVQVSTQLVKMSQIHSGAATESLPGLNTEKLSAAKAGLNRSALSSGELNSDNSVPVIESIGSGESA